MFKKNSVLSALKSALRNESGNFAMIMGLTAFPLIGVTALAVDYANFERQKSFVQSSLDAAALATSKEYASGAFTGTPAEVETKLETYAKDFFEANLPSQINKEKVTLNAVIEEEEKQDSNGIPFSEKSVALDVDLEYDTFFAKAIDYEKMTSRIASEVAMGNLTVEIALVVDNSGSMNTGTSGGGTRIVKARDTAKSMVDQIHAAGAISNKENPVSFALVPFAASVNIGVDNSTKNWMDTNGWASIHNENLNWEDLGTSAGYSPPSGATVAVTNKGTNHNIAEETLSNGTKDWKTRFDVYAMLGRTWAGCVEMRKWPHNTQDTFQTITSSMTYDQAAGGAGGGNGVDALFVPMFAPSEPMRTYRRTTSSTSNDYYRSYSNNYTEDFKKSNNAFFAAPAGTYGSGLYVNNADTGQLTRQNWVWRYQNNAKSITSSKKPDISCTTKPLTELSTSKTTIKTAIDQMQPNGNTNVQEGVAWGWRTLSDNEPFTAGRPNNDIDNRKYMIVLTDGNNTYGTNNSPNGSSYAAWGYAKHARIDAGLSNSDLPALYQGQSMDTYEKKMNAHTLQTCENAKNDGVTVFTIAFDVPNGSSVKSLLNACAGSGKDQDGDQIIAGGTFYYDANGSTLSDAMASIASQISEMRIKR